MNNPVKYTDPTGHRSEDELKKTFGENWHDDFFGEKAVFEGRDELLKFLLSDRTQGKLELEIVHQLMGPAKLSHQAGTSFENIDALGGRFAVTGGGGLFGGLNFDAVLNITSGQLTAFLSPEVGFVLGESGNASVGITGITKLPSNDDSRGTFMAVGLQGGADIGLTAEGFWASPMSDNFWPTDKSNGAFVGGGGAIPGIGLYGSLSYSVELYRLSSQGAKALPYVPGLGDIAREITGAVYHDILLHPALNPNSPFRRY